jgi:sigma-E factor negative regulatory protein RseA
MVRHAAGFAIAASVAAVAVLGVRSLSHEAEPPGTYTAMGVTTPVSDEYVRISSMRWDSARPELDSRLTHYLVNHNEYASSAGMNGMLSYGRIAGHDAR